LEEGILHIVDVCKLILFQYTFSNKEKNTLMILMILTLKKYFDDFDDFDFEKIL